MEDRRKKLDQLISQRDGLRESVQRVQGRLDSARVDLARVEEECRKRKVAPDQLDAAINQLQTRYEAALAELATKLQEAEAQVAPFLADQEE